MHIGRQSLLVAGCRRWLLLHCSLQWEHGCTAGFSSPWEETGLGSSELRCLDVELSLGRGRGPKQRRRHIKCIPGPPG